MVWHQSSDLLLSRVDGYYPSVYFLGHVPNGAPHDAEASANSDHAFLHGGGGASAGSGGGGGGGHGGGGAAGTPPDPYGEDSEEDEDLDEGEEVARLADTALDALGTFTPLFCDSATNPTFDNEQQQQQQQQQQHPHHHTDMAAAFMGKLRERGLEMSEAEARRIFAARLKARTGQPPPPPPWLSAASFSRSLQDLGFAPSPTDPAAGVKQVLLATGNGRYWCVRPPPAAWAVVVVVVVGLLLIVEVLVWW